MVQSDEALDCGRIHDFDAMLDRYYYLRSWTRDGIPAVETLRRLGLEEPSAVADQVLKRIDGGEIMSN